MENQLNKKHYQINMPIFIIAQLGFWTSICLSYKQIMTGKFCPPLFNIPACYFSLLFFILIIVSLFLKEKLSNYFFYIPAFLGLAMATWFSTLQIFDTTPFIQHCPQFYNIPLCYASFFVFLALIILYRFTNKKVSNLLATH